MVLDVPDDVLKELRTVFVAVEGACEAWMDDEIVRRVFIRGAMDYVKSSGGDFTAVQAMAAQLRGALA